MKRGVPSAGNRQDKKSKISPRAIREKWFRETLGLGKINANNGTINCAHCTLRLDDYISVGSTNGEVTPVPVEDANLFTSPIIKKRTPRARTFNITASTTEDERIIKRCVLPYLVNNMSIVHEIVEKEDKSDVILDLTADEPEMKTPQSVRLIRVDTTQDNLNERLKNQARRAKDGTCHGIIFLTHNNGKIAHVIEYFVDSEENNNEVYLVDAQKNRITEEINLKAEGYLSDVFFIPTRPPEGFKIKKESNLRSENENTPDAFVAKVMLFAENENEEELEIYLAESDYDLNINSIFTSPGMNAVKQLANQNKIRACLWLVERGGSLMDCAEGAASGGHIALLHKCLKRMASTENKDIDDENADHIVKIAKVAAKEGRMSLAKTLVKKYITVIEVKQLKNYHYYYLINDIICEAALNGHTDLVDELIILMEINGLKVDYNSIINTAAIANNRVLLEDLTIKMKMKQLKIPYGRMASNAASVGHTELAEELKEKKLELMNKPRLEKKSTRLNKEIILLKEQNKEIEERLNSAEEQKREMEELFAKEKKNKIEISEQHHKALKHNGEITRKFHDISMQNWKMGKRTITTEEQIREMEERLITAEEQKREMEQRFIEKEKQLNSMKPLAENANMLKNENVRLLEEIRKLQEENTRFRNTFTTLGGQMLAMSNNAPTMVTTPPNREIPINNNPSLSVSQMQQVPTIATTPLTWRAPNNNPSLSVPEIPPAATQSQGNYFEYSLPNRGGRGHRGRF